MATKNNIVISIFILIILLLLLYNMLYTYRTLKEHSNKIDILGRYVNKYINNNTTISSTPAIMNNNTTISGIPPFIKSTEKISDNPEKGIKKFVIYHMKGCGHCHNFMDVKQNNNMTKCEELKDIFKNDSSVKILDFQYGRDEEAKKFNAFPMFRIITENGITEYNKNRDVSSMVDAIKNTI